MEFTLPRAYSSLRHFRSIITFEGEKRILIFVMIAVSVMSAYLTLQTRGNLYVPITILMMLALVTVTFYRIDWGLFIFIGAVLVFDNYEIPGFPTLTFEAGYFWPFNSLIPGLGIGIVTPMELHLLLLYAVLVVLVLVRRKMEFKRFSPGLAASLFFVWLIAALLYGSGRGGDLQRGFWEIRALGYLCLMLLLVPQIIETKHQLEILVWCCIVAISIKALQGVARFASLGFQFQGFRTMTNHEDPVFIVTLFVLFAGLLYFGGNRNQRRALWGLLFPLFLGYYVANRRAAYAAFGVSVLTFILLLSAEERRRIIKGLAVLAVLFSVYLAAYWNSGGRIAVVAQEVRSTLFANDKEEIGYEDYTSGLARKQEDYNTATTLRRSPIVGIGFGTQFDVAIQSWGAYALKGYICHNEIFWVLGKTGSIGFFLFLLFLNATMIYGGFVFSHLTDPYLKSLCAMCIAAVIGQVVVSYVDMQLTFYRNMVYLGMLVSLIPVLGRIEVQAHNSGISG